MLLPKDYLRFQLTGEYASEVSDASGTALFDVVNRRWSYELVDAVGLDRSILPKVYESSEVSGTISREAAEATGLAAGTPVVGGGGDQAASAVGNGIVEPGAGVLHARHVGRGVRAYGKSGVRPTGPRPYVLSCGARQVARDGSDAGRGIEPAMVPQQSGAGRSLRRRL